MKYPQYPPALFAFVTLAAVVSAFMAGYHTRGAAPAAGEPIDPAGRVLVVGQDGTRLDLLPSGYQDNRRRVGVPGPWQVIIDRPAGSPLTIFADRR